MLGRCVSWLEKVSAEKRAQVVKAFELFYVVKSSEEEDEEGSGFSLW